jgi:chromosome segregation ATPase
VAALRQEAGEAAALIASLQGAAAEAEERQAALLEEGAALRGQVGAAEAEAQAVAERLAVAEGHCAEVEAELQSAQQQGGWCRSPQGWRWWPLGSSGRE